MSELNEFFNELNEECGIFGVFNSPISSELTYYGLHALQHRGQEACGIVTCNKGEMFLKKGEGLITEVFTKNEQFHEGENAIGHVRYSTAGGNNINNVQPFLFRHSTGDFSLAHNGNIINSKELKLELEREGSIFQSTSDSEILAHIMKKDQDLNRVEAIKRGLKKLQGGFAFLIMTHDRIYACRDKNGLRPLSLGIIGESTYILASETCAFNSVGAKFVRDLLPGEILTITKNGLRSTFYTEKCNNNMCAMEYIYFSRPDSDIDLVNVHYFRKQSGKYLAKYFPCDADIVIGVPDSSLSAAIGYAEESGIPYEVGMVKNKYIGRTFIQPSQELRDKSVRMKLSIVKQIVEGKRVVLIDDSIVRGTTSRKIVSLLRNAGATEVHLRIASPEIKFPCYYGVDISTLDELISARKTKDGVRKEINADSLEFLPIDALKEILNRTELCTACFSGHYPTDLFSYGKKKE